LSGKTATLVHGNEQVWTTSVWTGLRPTETDRFRTESNRTDYIGSIRSIVSSRPIGPVQIPVKTEDRPIGPTSFGIHIKDGM